MNILFVHQNFPGQFRHLAPALAQAGHAVHALSRRRSRDTLSGGHRRRAPRYLHGLVTWRT
ncbi:MAG: hypothetical protein Q8M01_14310 [Rubrivivax sp.]|nr:hypothetical protein [Rubrivivax sp.]